MQVYQPKADKKGTLKYGTVLLIPKTAVPTIAELKSKLTAFLESRWPDPATRPRKLPVKDGDVPNGNGNIPAGYAGNWVINTTSKNQPQLRDEHVQPVLDPNKFYGGCWVNAQLNFFEYNTDGNRGVGVGLGSLQFVRGDTKLAGGAPDPSKAFQPVPGSAAAGPAANGDSADSFLS
jgi:hypothetical protein